MSLARVDFYREVADLAVPGEFEGVPAASERSIGLIDLAWQRQPPHVDADTSTLKTSEL
jgi:shikimate kinase